MPYRFNQNFNERLQLYGIQESLQERVSIDEEAIWDDHSSPFRIKLIKTDDLDEIKRLIGIDDNYLEEKSVEQPETKAAKTLTEVTTDTAMLAASAYVFGNSKDVKHLKNDIEKIIGSVTIQFAAVSECVINELLTIKPGETKVIDTDHLIFEGKGKILCEGTLILNASVITNSTNLR